ncbi:hypothetical protein Mgra_00008011 [Meloidogyne graminicola]|uniref:Uncharacterized protein n=1 Tax=Meloidogyne graminicola TaxID=189291 RepID=A0A8S9ZGX4_9BILA|nr:hypothetical protein Mgra_00008011 [Meloidogyne graminicola]
MSDTVNFDQFVRDYLNVGEVQGIYYYPTKKLAIASLHPGAIIDGKSVSTNGVVISTADREDFIYNPIQFVHSIRDAEYKLGVDQRDNVPILVRQTVPTARKMVYAFLMILTCMALLNYYKGSVRTNMFRIVSSAANKKKEKK